MLNNVEKVEAPKKVFSGFAENRSKK